MNLHIIAVTAAIISFPVCAETLIWTGGSASSDNFSDAANWSPAQSPASGDTLVFAGETRTSPVNDLDPELFSFKTLVFTNDNSAGRSAPFTLSGNKLKITASIELAKAVSADSLTETFDLEVEHVGNGRLLIGGANLGNHHLTFNKKFSGPANQKLENPSQYSGTIWFNGPVDGFSHFYHPNGAINVYFRGLNTAFAGNGGYEFNQGNLYFIDPDNVGPSYILRSGQGNYTTAGSIYFDPTNSITIAATIGVTSPSQQNDGLTLWNKTAGTTVTFTGDVVENGTNPNNGALAGTRLVVDGNGDGVFTGSFTKDRMAFTKKGSGTWTLSDAIETCSMTGLVTVSAGKLVVDCALQPNQRMTVSANATIAGKGTLGESVTFASNARYDVAADGDAPAILTVPGTVILNGSVTVNRTGGSALAPGSRTLLLTYAKKEGIGSFIAGSGFPDNAVFTAEATALYVDVPTESRVWNGEASGEWNDTDYNWNGGMLFADGSVVSFPDLSDASKRAVSIPAAVSPLSASISANGDRPYVFSGEGGVDGATSIEFSGTATNVWAAPMKNVMAASVAAGRLILEGPVADSTLLVGQNATLTQSVASAISDAASVAVFGPTADLCGTNTFTGGLAVGMNNGSNLPRTDVNIRTPGALGNGDVSVNYNSYLNIYADCAVTNRTLHFWGYNNMARISVYNRSSFDWAGDIVVHEYPSGELIMSSDCTVRLGNADGSSTFSTTHGRAVTVVGDIHLYANVNSGAGFSFRNNLWLYSTNNVWSSFGINTGTAYMMAKNALPGNRPVTMLQQWGKVNYQANLDLNGFDQTITGLNVTDYDKTVTNWARIRSATPATLTISNATDSSFSDITTFYVQDCVTLRKMGLGTWTLGCQNTSTGDFEVVEGTVALAAAESLPVGEKSTLRITEGAVLNLPEGIAAEISYAERIIAGKTRMVRAGLYGGQDCTAAGVVKTDWISGAGTLAVKHDNGGTIMFVR